MLAPDLYGLRERFDRERIMLCFNGPISRSLIEEIGNALKNYLAAEQVKPAAAMDVFAVYIELTQNIRHYAVHNGSPDSDTATVVISRVDAPTDDAVTDGHYVVSAGNMVRQADGEALIGRIEALAAMDKVALKVAYKEQLRKPRDMQATTGAGLGLIDMARKSSAPMSASLKPLNDGWAFFSIRVQI
ncbi:biofilm regulation protein kinase SiaB [Pokkaliibacter sp. MBI-7]|uniref:biofilm regulation protein kinase SiaB n=1 Tax=Pokkaliibacter sp. MBI-7 TaxID=3040600 RepID=UPI0024473551|nr:biofilm regulation protein kinase SiaB [Pokkaliibacter sp. MBI-7]MDH2433357.1 biofilm regulation protein kinase SiaB [Pokkaliibacter sp. MBI-7]